MDAAGNVSLADPPAVGQFLTGSAATAIPGLFGTGLTASGAAAPAGSTDPHYQLTVSAEAGTTGQPARVVNDVWPLNGGPWLENSGLSKWVGPTAVQNPATAPPGAYTYRATFSLAGLDHASAVLTGRFAADNSAALRVNGAVRASTTSFSTWTPFLVTSGFLTGINTIEFEVENGGFEPNPTGLRVELSGTAVPTSGGSGGGGSSTLEFFSSLPPEAYTLETFTSPRWIGTRIATGAAAVNITQLGRRRAPGNSGTHTVGIFDAYNAATPVATAAVDMSAGVVGEFVYAPVNYQLQANKEYWIASLENTTDSHYTTNWTTEPGTTGVATVACAVSAPASGGSAGPFEPNWYVKLPYGPVNFKYSTGQAPGPALSEVSAVATMTSGQTITGAVLLNGPAQGATVVTLAKTGPVTVPGSVTVANGQTSAPFEVTATTVSSATGASIQAMLAGVTKSAPAITVNPPPPPASPTLASVTTVSQVSSGQTVTATVTLTGPAQGDTVVTLTKNGPVTTNPAASVTVANGQTSKTFEITGGTVTTQTSATVTGSLGAVSRTAGLTVTTAGTPFFGAAPTGLYTTVSNITGWWGTRIQVGANPIPVKFLGRMKLAGNTGQHRVGIFTAYDNLTPIAEVTVDLASGTVGEYVYGAVNYTLQPGTTYWIASLETAGMDSWLATSSTAEPVITNVASVQASTWTSGVSGSFNPDWNVKLPYGPVNFKY